MPAPFDRLDLDEFIALLWRFPFERRIDSVHMHHTWRPRQDQWSGHDTILGMWRYHTETRGWRDIAQHLSIAPDGGLWLGRNWNLPPVSARGYNGNSVAGPFMFEMIGDFDRGQELLEGAQRDAALHVVSHLQERFGLEPRSLRFHNHMSSKTCPGSSLDYDEVLQEVVTLREGLEAPEDLAEAARTARGGPFEGEPLRVERILRSFASRIPEGEDPVWADHLEELERDPAALLDASAPEGARSARGWDLTPAMARELAPHVVNLVQGRFSTEGEYATDEGDVRAIFEESLPAAREAARDRGEPLRVLFWAHGGLVSEKRALRYAYETLSWWKANHVYPIYFVWETGLLETVGQLLRRGGERAARGARDFWDWTSDPVLQGLVRVLQGPRIWGGMKRSAERASEPGGGALFVARRLRDFLKDAEEGEVEVHAVGHSAGSIFHAHFLPQVLKMTKAPVESLHYLAPAVTVEDFGDLLADTLGESGIRHLTLYTMDKATERRDHVIHVYRKSLLYLIHHALEPERKTAILGLEKSLRGNRGLRRLLGLAGDPAPHAQVLWSPTRHDTGRSATTSTSHGGFDNDAATMNSVVRRVLDRADDEEVVPFPEDSVRSLLRLDTDPWANVGVDWPDDLPEAPAHAGEGPAWTPGITPGGDAGAPEDGPGPIVVTGGDGAPGRRRALCVGIDEYASAPLSGCVADAELWAETLKGRGFAYTQILRDGQASRAAILDSLRGLVRESRAGDVVVFQYSGHGTQLPDHGGDEAGGTTPLLDEALCPHDYTTGAFVIDDDLRRIFVEIPRGVNVTCFVDCCHSGTVSRLLLGPAAGTDLRAVDERPRYLPATPAMARAHRVFRRRREGGSRIFSRGPEGMKEVLFSACRSDELAWESGGQGDFTRQATRLLREGGTWTHAGFQRDLDRAFGPSPRQHPQLDCAASLREHRLLAPRAQASSAQTTFAAGGDRAAGGWEEGRTTADLLRLLAERLEPRP